MPNSTYENSDTWEGGREEVRAHATKWNPLLALEAPNQYSEIK